MFVNRIRSLVFVSACVTLFPAAVLAQTPAPRANTEKLMLSLGLGGTSLYSEDFEDENHSYWRPKVGDALATNNT